MNVEKLRETYYAQLAEIEAKGKEPEYVRMTCEQIDFVKRNLHMDLTADASFELKFKGLLIVARGSRADVFLRESKNRRPYIDFTKVE